MSAGTLDFRTANTLWASVLVETLVRQGVTRAVISPGSRSTPLTLALTRHDGIEAVPVLDERSAAFFALGQARRLHQPVVLVCTSGTAGANYYPAVIEAQESAVPLLIITADRPPELRSCASGQTIDQQNLFGGHVNFYHELAVAEASLPLLRYLRQTVAQAVACTQQPQPGPVHLNAPFRDPLAPPAGATVALAPDQIGDGFFRHLTPVETTARRQVSLWPEGVSSRGVIVAGPEIPADPAGYAVAVGRLAAQTGWPVLADGVSPLRQFAAGTTVVVTAYDAILRHESTARALRPEQVLCLGGWPTSKVLRQWLEKSDAQVALVTARFDNRDGLHGRTRPVVATVAELALGPGKPAEGTYAQSWKAAEAAVTKVLRQTARPAGGVFEGDVVPVLAAALPQDTPIFVASSMPVRDVEYFWPPGDRRMRFYFNRGANGIDGTLSSALGVAHRAEQPAVLLTGDLALLHDSNGFLLRPKLRGSLTVVLINNRGGGIFEHLPVARHEPPFEEYFATPQAVDIGALARAHGVEHVAVRSRPELADLVRQLPAQGIRVLEVATDRKADAAFRQSLFATAAAALDGA
ncbi:MAG: 2-succinyl-5-enolpyruvyl-6-hydroxy-3-cyclohexene-1-carboxylic-acid synthase [Opitutales bacterium]